MQSKARVALSAKKGRYLREQLSTSSDAHLPGLGLLSGIEALICSRAVSALPTEVEWRISNIRRRIQEAAKRPM